MAEKNWKEFPIQHFFRGWYLKPSHEQERQAFRAFIFNIAKKLNIPYIIEDETKDVKKRIARFFQNNTEIFIAPFSEELITKEEAMMISEILNISLEYKNDEKAVIKSRFTEKELLWNAKYALKEFWPEAEPYIDKDTYIYAMRGVKGRWPEAEHIIMKNAKSAHGYVRNVLEDRWPEAEPVIMQDPELAYSYALNVIKGRWPEAEPYIAKDLDYAYYYALYVIRGRFTEAEPYIAKNPRAAYQYAKDIVKGRWPEAESVIMNNPLSSRSYTENILNKT